MFTGLIKEIATIENINNNVLQIGAKHKPSLGDSIAINGACLSVISIFEGGFCVELGAESAKILSQNKLCGEVHLEPAMKLSDRVEGHLLQGHIDCIGKITQITKKQNSYEYTISFDEKYSSLVVNKGSISIDGVSLTINLTSQNSLSVSIIPITYNNTLFNTYILNSDVHLEFDILGKYVQKMLNQTHKNKNDWGEVDKVLSIY